MVNLWDDCVQLLCLLLFIFSLTGKLASKEYQESDRTSADWISARYKQNRGIVHDGNFPHLSTPITHIKPGFKRVILGFNCFSDAVGECCLRAPEHSDAFNRTIKLYQTMASLGVPITASSASSGGDKYSSGGSSSQINTEVRAAEGTSQSHCTPKKGVNIKDIVKNKALSRLLVTAAKRLKEKENQEREAAALSTSTTGNTVSRSDED